MGYKEDLMGLGMPGELANLVEAHDSSTGTLLPAADNTSDIGSVARSYRNVFVDGVSNLLGKVQVGGQTWTNDAVNVAGRVGISANESYQFRNSGGATVASLGNGVVDANNCNLAFSTQGGGTVRSRWTIDQGGALIQDASFGGPIVLTAASTSVAQTAAATITAAGTTISDATPLTAVYNAVTTVAAATGVRLPNLTIGSTVIVQNLGANNLEVYPFTGGAVNGAATNAGITLAAATDDVGTFHRVSTNLWIGTVAAGPAT